MGAFLLMLLRHVFPVHYCVVSRYAQLLFHGGVSVVWSLPHS